MRQKRIKANAIEVTFFNDSIADTIEVKEMMTELPLFQLEPNTHRTFEDHGKGVIIGDMIPPYTLIWNSQNVSCLVKYRKKI